MEPEKGVISDDSDMEMSDSSDDEDAALKKRDIDQKATKYRTYTFDMLFKLILKNCPDSYLPKIRAIAAFQLFTSENFIRSLLINRLDVIAAEHRYIKYYGQDLTADLVIFAIRNQNEEFLCFALQSEMLNLSSFKDEGEKAVRQELLTQLESKAKTEFVLNILIYADYSLW